MDETDLSSESAREAMVEMLTRLTDQARTGELRAMAFTTLTTEGMATSWGGVDLGGNDLFALSGAVDVLRFRILKELDSGSRSS